MDAKELQRTDRLLIATGIFILILIIGIATARRPYIEYEHDLATAALDASDPAAVITPEAASELFGTASGNVFIIDIRSIYDFDKGHLENAVHIPKLDLLSRENIKLFRKAAREKKTILLYGTDQLDATGPAMLLRDIGLDNVKALAGGYEIASLFSQGKGSSSASVQPETPKYDYSEMTASPKEGQITEPEAAFPEIIVPVRKAKSKAEGGC